MTLTAVPDVDSPEIIQALGAYEQLVGFICDALAEEYGMSLETKAERAIARRTYYPASTTAIEVVLANPALFARMLDVDETLAAFVEVGKLALQTQL